MPDQKKWLTAGELAKLKTNPPECADKLRQIVKDVATHPGEFVLVVERHEEMHGCPGIIAPRHIPDEFYHLEEDYMLGVLDKDGQVKLSKDLFSMAFPTGWYAQWDSPRSRDKARAYEDNLIAGTRVFSLLQLDQPCKSRERSVFDLLKPRLALEIVVGDEAVEEWFALKRVENPADDAFFERYRKQYALLFRTLCEAVGKPNRAMRLERAEASKKEIAQLSKAFLEELGVDIAQKIKRAEELGMSGRKEVEFWKGVLKELNKK